MKHSILRESEKCVCEGIRGENENSLLVVNKWVFSSDYKMGVFTLRGRRQDCVQPPEAVYLIYV